MTPHDAIACGYMLAVFTLTWLNDRNWRRVVRRQAIELHRLRTKLAMFELPRGADGRYLPRKGRG